MGHIRDRWKDPARRGKGKRWQVKVQVDGRERDGGSFDNKEVAKRKLVELEASVHRGQWVDPNNPTTVAELVRARVEIKNYRARTTARVESMIRNHVEGTPLGKRRVVKVKPSEVQAWVSDRAKLMAPGTLRILVSLVSGAFDAAVLDGIVGVTPFRKITLPEGAKEQLVALTVEQVDLLADSIGARYRAMVVVQSSLGLRIGELLALRVEDVDFLRRTVRIEDQIDRVTRERVPPKTPWSKRTLPLLTDVAAAELSRHIAAYPPTPEGLIFHTRSGLPVGHDWYNNKILVPAARKAGLPEGTTSHQLRHHFASVLLKAGVPVTDVAKYLGHKTPALVISTYGHWIPGGEEVARKVIEAAWKAARTTSPDAATAQGLPR